MPRRVLFIDGGPRSLRDECDAALGHLISERASWGAPLRERLRQQEFDLVLALAPARSTPPGNFFGWLAESRIGAPLIAVLPPDDDLIRVAAPSVDDFVVAPFRPRELQQRVARLLGEDGSEKAAAHDQLSRELALSGLV